jgi:predicted Ser/Thr protein kinase
MTGLLVGERVDLVSGRMLLHYRLLERLGEGGMGVVWKALDTTLDREVAIKILPAAFAADPERLSRFEREAKVLASLNHPNVAAVYGLHVDGGVRFLAMELVRGRSLGAEIARGLAPARVIELATAIADGLAAAHRQQVTHRDLKPDNIMIDGDGRPKILDFGLAKLGAIVSPPSPDAPTELKNTTTTQHGSLLGTAAYMSPEQAQGKPVDQRSDVFSFGVVLYEMASGQRPFVGDNTVSTLTAILRDTPAPVSTVAPSAPKPLDRIVGRCLEKDPARRYADASGVRDDLRALADRPAAKPAKRSALLAVAAVLAVALGVAGVFWAKSSSRGRWVRDEALPQLEGIVDRIQGLQEGRESWDAYVLARKIEEVAPKEPLLERLRPRFVREIGITSEPPGASVYARYYDEPDAPPILIGTTPMDKARYPLGFTRIHLELPGKEPIDDVIWNLSLAGKSWDYRFHDPGEVPDGMSWIPAGSSPLYIPGLDDLAPEPTTAFLMDRHEVTNGEYKKFVDAGGYADPKYWTEPFVDGASTLSQKDAMARFVDRTGRPGPSTWEIGTFPEGHESYPVAGVSWYEAAAYAAWAGKSLPTVFHWNRVAFTLASSRTIPLANLAGKDLVPVGSTKSMNRWGVSDLAGNVREWTWNEAGHGPGRFILGGGWNDPDYAFADAFAQPAFDRAPTNGFRCVKYLDKDPNLAALHRTLDRPFRDFKAEKPVDDATFAIYLRQCAYDKTPLDAKIEEEKPMPYGVRQKVTFNAAYGGERMMAYVFVPPAGKPPYQVVVEFPGSGVIETRSSESIDPGRIDFLLKSGRVLVYPIYKGTYERRGISTRLPGDIGEVPTTWSCGPGPRADDRLRRIARISMPRASRTTA